MHPRYVFHIRTGGKDVHRKKNRHQQNPRRVRSVASAPCQAPASVCVCVWCRCVEKRVQPFALVVVDGVGECVYAMMGV